MRRPTGEEALRSFTRLPGVEQARRLDAGDPAARAILSPRAWPHTSAWCCRVASWARHGESVIRCRRCRTPLVEIVASPRGHV